jgi:hypothetical protein
VSRHELASIVWIIAREQRQVSKWRVLIVVFYGFGLLWLGTKIGLLPVCSLVWSVLAFLLLLSSWVVVFFFFFLHLPTSAFLAIEGITISFQNKNGRGFLRGGWRGRRKREAWLAFGWRASLCLDILIQFTCTSHRLPPIRLHSHGARSSFPLVFRLLFTCVRCRRCRGD